MKFDADGITMAVGTSNGLVCLFDLRNNKPRCAPGCVGPWLPIGCGQGGEGPQLLAAHQHHRVLLPGGGERWRPPAPSSPQQLQPHPQGIAKRSFLAMEVFSFMFYVEL
jgi:hypothetical protein